ncbi:ATP-binding cassette domain-containing protein [Paenibacillus sp. Marseille-Q4541]|uniref:methionine ABC transporter ATP-binding protein n=1 Tax=Paenibacillus sp. Marseille-Q4541 TaxID=2831522 RepID=UPI001BA525F4|nr:ATP-binding cassette domain-containing protein [Paenibacillus sp. Marseille-Q4541]
MISLDHVSKSFGSEKHGRRLTVVDGVSLHIEQGSIHGIIGASGAGKSTLLRMINLLERPDQGQVYIGGQELTGMRERELREARRKIGMIFQHFNLIANRTVEGNVAIPLELAGVKKEERSARVREYLQFVGLEDKAKQYPAELSGGQKQRVAIARALANEPQVLLCDEPTSALDPKTTSGVLEVLRHVNEAMKITIVIVTHEVPVVEKLCNAVSFMDAGKIVRTLPITEGALPPDMLAWYEEQEAGDDD